MSVVVPIGLTPTQRDVLLIIQELTAVYGAAPGYRDIARECSFGSPSGVARVIDRLEERGFIARTRGKNRSLAVLRPIPMPEDFPFELTAAGLAAAGAVA